MYVDNKDSLSIISALLSLDIILIANISSGSYCFSKHLFNGK